MMLQKAEANKRRRNNHQFLQNYVLNWSHAPLVIMDEEVEENEEYAMKEYIRHYTSPMVSKPLKYDLKNLNNQYSSTTINPWADLMYKNEYLPNSFSGNMLRKLQIQSS